jgi:hypothetical protein
MGNCAACGRGIRPGNQFCTACGAPARPPGVPWHRRWSVVTGIMLAAVVCGVGLAALLFRTPNGSPPSLSAGQKPAISTPASQAEGSPPPSPAPSGSGLASAPPAEQTAAKGLAQLLASSASDRGAVVAAVNDVNSCGSGLSQDVQTFQQAVASRQQLVSQLSSLSGVSILPAQMIQDLSAAWQASIQADQDFAAWASDENSGNGCTSDDSENASYQAASGPDNEATADKKAFVSLWNPIATQYGLATYIWNQL